MIDMMSKKQARMSRPPSSTQIDGLRWVLPALVVLTMLTIGGCGGCRSEEPQSKAEKEKAEKEKEEEKKEKRKEQIVDLGILAGATVFHHY